MRPNVSSVCQLSSLCGQVRTAHEEKKCISDEWADLRKSWFGSVNVRKGWVVSCVVCVGEFAQSIDER